MKQPSFIVEHKDGQNATTRFFGPFVSLNIATEFRDNLPKPLSGGESRIRTLQRYTSQEHDLVSRLIFEGRIKNVNRVHASSYA